VKKEMSPFEASKTSDILEKLYQAVIKIKLTSVKAERASSATVLFVTKL